MSEDDWAGWQHVTTALGCDTCRSSATTSSSPTPSGLQRGIDEGVANALLVKVNQIGSLTRDDGRGRPRAPQPATAA